MSGKTPPEFQSQKNRRTSSRVELIEGSFAAISEDLRCIKKAVLGDGNGSTGLVRKVDRLELKHEVHDKTIAGMVDWMEELKQVSSNENLKQHIKDLRFLLSRYWLISGAIVLASALFNLVFYILTTDSIRDMLKRAAGGG